jgi:hypothetical protein
MKTNLPSNRILPETRWVAVLVIPFLTVAAIILYIFPQDTGQVFAWKLQPRMSAMMLGSAYAGGIYFFTAVLVSKYWHRVKVGFLPVMAFASILGIATLLHWDRFNHQRLAFYAWAGLYFTTPFIVLAVWLRNQRYDPHQPEAHELLIPLFVRLATGVAGLVTLAISLILFLKPSLLISLWPWTLTPLTARVVGAMFALPGLVGLGIAADRRWSAAQVILQSQGFSILLILIAAVRARGDYDWSKPASWLFVGGLAAMLAGILLLFVAAEVLSRKRRF